MFRTYQFKAIDRPEVPVSDERLHFRFALAIEDGHCPWVVFFFQSSMSPPKSLLDNGTTKRKGNEVLLTVTASTPDVFLAHFQEA